MSPQPDPSPTTRLPDPPPDPKSGARSIRPFPWGSLDILRGADVAALREARRWTRGLARPEAIAASLGELTGTAARFLVRKAARFAEAATIAAPTTLPGSPAFAAGTRVEPPGAVGVLLRGHGDAGGPLVLIEAERVLATGLVARILRRPLPPSPPYDGAPVSPALAGAFAAVVAAVARRLDRDRPGAAPVPVEIVAAGDAREILPRLIARSAGEAGSTAPTSPVVVSVALTVVLGDEAFAATVFVAVPAAHPGLAREPAGAATWSEAALRSLGATPLALPIVAFEALTTVADVASLRPGDVWLLGQDAGQNAASWDLRGRVLLAGPSSELGAGAELVERGRLVLSDELGPFTRKRRRETDMPESDAKAALLNAVGDVPVVVRVEVGEARMLAREWADLGRGDIVTLGRRVGEQVVLRVGGVAVARGELVTVDGEVGVRIAERITGESSTL